MEIYGAWWLVRIPSRNAITSLKELDQILEGTRSLPSKKFLQGGKCRWGAAAQACIRFGEAEFFQKTTLTALEVAL